MTSIPFPNIPTTFNNAPVLIDGKGQVIWINQPRPEPEPVRRPIGFDPSRISNRKAA